MSGSNEEIPGISIEAAASRLQQGGLVAVPTETVYGLAADATDAQAVAEIYRTKGRPEFNPLIVHVLDISSAQKLGDFNKLAMLFAEHFWPGPLTLVLPRSKSCRVATAVTAGLNTIALRSPAHKIMRDLLNASGLVLAAPSANKSGGISPTTPTHVLRSLSNLSPPILDGGKSESGIESTIVAIRDTKYEILRPGPITAEELAKVAGVAANIRQFQGIEAPGQLSSHYSPTKPVRLNVSVARPDEYHIGFGELAGDANLSARGDLAEAASRLFALLHDADASDKTDIAVAAIPAIGIGEAINDRLARAAADIKLLQNKQ